MRIAASVEYAGQDFSGWQKQPKIKTIQGEIEKAIFSITNENIETTAAGRTDAGVHALGQIIHFDTNLKRPMNSWVKGINSFLPHSIRGRMKYLLIFMQGSLPKGGSINIYS